MSTARRHNQIKEAFATFPCERNDDFSSEEQTAVVKLLMLWTVGDIEVPRDNKTDEEVRGWIARTATYLAQDFDPDLLRRLRDKVLDGGRSG